MVSVGLFSYGYLNVLLENYQTFLLSKKQEARWEKEEARGEYNKQYTLARQFLERQRILIENQFEGRQKHFFHTLTKLFLPST
ncbi:CLUMA_CG017742, isoform A [Clunio marinus]|uniref:CLUMA_CG017742, isoform A n=1 Tax=Clunio marinus TaxID=568069 RepID=A0A1J1IZS8_9DIPT|nr:CLUMA_CG017742, isoform A [Clunio marinus]